MNKSLGLLIALSAVLMSLLLKLDVFTLEIQGKDAWRQSKTAWNIRYFVRHDLAIYNPRQPYLNNESNIVRYEFPLMQWSIAVVQKVTGEHIFVVRFMVFLISLLTVWAVFRLAWLLTADGLVSGIAAGVFVFLPTFFYGATNILPDVLALCFGMYYVLFFLRYLKDEKNKDLILSALFIAFAGLVKLPFILLGAFALVRFFKMIVCRPSYPGRQISGFALINALALLPVLAWYAFVIPGWADNNIAAGFTTAFVGWPLFFEFLKNQIVDIFPNEILSIPALIMLAVGVYYGCKERQLFFVKGAYISVPVFILFGYFFYILNVIREGHDYYLMPFYPVFVLLIILGLYRGLQWNVPGKIFVWILILAMPLVCWFRVKDYWEIKYAYFNPDFFNCRQAFSTIGSREDIAIFVNDESLAIFPYSVDKSGYIFWNDHLPVLWIKDMIKRGGARFLYSDSRIIEDQDGFEDCVEKKIMDCGTVRVFQLKTPDEIQMGG